MTKQSSIRQPSQAANRVSSWPKWMSNVAKAPLKNASSSPPPRRDESASVRESATSK
jgi:hypothetical protein